MSDSIFLIRHAEKPDPDANAGGVDLCGRTDPHGLSVRGWQRAGALAALFGGISTAPRHAMLTRPDVLFVAEDPGRSHRPRDTLRPLAELLGLKLHPLPADGDPAAVAGHLMATTGNVLVCWRHKELPGLARALLPGATHLVPAAWDEGRFDLVWVIASNRLTVVAQRLLAGDEGCTEKLNIEASA